MEARRVLSITLTPLGTYESGIFDDSAAEIVAYDAGSEQLFVTNSAEKRVDVLDASDPAAPTWVASLDTGENPTSVTVSEGLVAISVVADPETNPGTRATAQKRDGQSGGLMKSRTNMGIKRLP